MTQALAFGAEHGEPGGAFLLACAAPALAQSLAAARRFNPEVRIRLAREGAGVRFEFTDRAAPGDTEVACEDAELLVEAGLHGMLDTGDHNAPVLRQAVPDGSDG